MQLIGTLRIQRGDVVLGAHQLGGPKPRQILEILLLQLGTPVSKDRLIELLWGRNPTPEALATLESYVSVLRRNLQPGAGKNGPLRTTTGGYMMDPSLVDLDLDRFSRLHRRAQHAPAATAYPLLREALDLATAPLLGDELMPAWADDERALHATRVTEVAILAAQHAATLGKPVDAIAWASGALANEPLDERAWTALILALEQAGRHAEGLQAYARCRRTLDRELGCSPGATLRAAHARLLHATATRDDELSDVLAALLILQQQLAMTTKLTGEPRPTSSTPPAASLREAGNVIDSFLRRALAAA